MTTNSADGSSAKEFTSAAAPFAILTGASTGIGLSAGVLVVLVAFWFVVPQLARHGRQLDAESHRQPGLR